MYTGKTGEMKEKSLAPENDPGNWTTGAPWLLRGFDRAQTHLLTAEEIDHLVRRGIAGRYALGYRDARGAFRVQYVGYSPWDLNAELKARVGKSKYFRFRVGPLAEPDQQ